MPQGIELEDELLARDSDSVTGVVSARIACDHLEVIRKNVDNFAFALVAPLSSENHRSLCFAHSCLQTQTQTSCVKVVHRR